MSQAKPHNKAALKDYIQDLGRRARAAAQLLARAETGAKDQALHAMAAALLAQKEALRRANQKDLQAGKEKGLDAAMLDRLELTDARIEEMAEGLREVANLPDPIGEITELRYR